MAEELNINAEEELGEIKISEDVVLTVAGLAVNEVKGAAVVNSLADGFVEKFVKKNYGKGIRVVMEEKRVSIEVHIVVDYGVKITDVAAELQEAVKRNVENMTDLLVETVNIYVEGISVEPEEVKPKKAKKAEEKEEETAVETEE